MVNSNKKDNNFNINELIELFTDKINNIEIIDESIVEEIYTKLKNICENHNNKINNWYDKKYLSDLNEFNIKNNIFYEFTKVYKNNSFVLIEEN